MSSVSAARSLFALVLAAALAAAQQQCFYPDGTPSNDTPCGAGSGAVACCAPTAFCMDNGLCFGGGIVSRGSCTDVTWGSKACAGYCRNASPGSSVPLTPCSSQSASNSFVCGIGASTAQCSNTSAVFSLSGGASVVLRPAQVQALLQPALNSLEASSSATASPSACPSSASGMYTAAEMVGLGFGLGAPLLFFICATLFFFQRARQKSSHGAMYKIPDASGAGGGGGVGEGGGGLFTPAFPPMHLAAVRSVPGSRDGSIAATSLTSPGWDQSSPPLQQQHPFASPSPTSDRFRFAAVAAAAAEKPLTTPRSAHFPVVELPGSPAAHELSVSRARTLRSSTAPHKLIGPPPPPFAGR